MLGGDGTEVGSSGAGSHEAKATTHSQFQRYLDCRYGRDGSNFFTVTLGFQHDEGVNFGWG